MEKDSELEKSTKKIQDFHPVIFDDLQLCKCVKVYDGDTCTVNFRLLNKKDNPIIKKSLRF